MKKAVVTNCKITSEFSNGFDVDFILLGDPNTYHGKLYQNNDVDGSYSMAVFMEDGFSKYSDEPKSEVTDLIAAQIIQSLKIGDQAEKNVVKNEVAIKEEDKILYICRYDEDSLDDGLVGMYTAPEETELASIDDLILDMNEQKIDLLNGDHADGYLIPWEKYLVVKEGVAIWNEVLEEYIITGSVSETGELVINEPEIVDQKKYAVLKEEITLYFPADGTDYAECTFPCGDALEIIGEVVYRVGSETILHYVVKATSDTSPFTVPSSKSLVAVGSHNLENARELIEVEDEEED